jgi:hypothetical protein
MDHAVFPDLLVARVQNQIGVLFLQGAACKLLQFFVKLLGAPADGAGREGVPAQLLGDFLDLPGGDSLHIHLRQSRDQGLLAALIPFKQLGLKHPFTVLRHP